MTLSLRFQLFLGVLILGIVGGVAQLFQVTDITCTTTDNQSCPTSVQASLNSAIGKSFFFTNFERDFSASDAETQPYTIQSINKILPGTLVVMVQLETPAYLLITKDGQYSISQSGSVIAADSHPQSLATITIQSEIPIIADGKLPDKYHSVISSILEEILRQEMVVATITWVDDQTLYVDLQNGPRVVLESQTAGQRVQHLPVILQSTEVKSLPQLAEIDLRFKLPVLRTRQ